jgi:DNA-binding NarL/FixJ family response regulator
VESTRVLIADDHRLMLAGVRRALQAAGIEVVAEVSVGTQVVPAVGRVRPDVVLLDVRMPELDGLTCLERIRRLHPDVTVVMLSASTDEAQIEQSREHGAAAYVVKTIAPVDLPAIVRAAVAGEAFVVHGMPSAARPDYPEDLSEREVSVLKALARGLSNREIGRELWVTEQTVKFHLRNIYRKLDIGNRTEAARYAYRHGLADSQATVGAERPPAGGR